ncbi:MAG: hypothetical protein DWQ47_17375 [Acidobacteria bacterium]|nr:MAG: hypothetical protein DWQ32_04775 [Acidobacteriota bacterium]REK14010.1 MAG: hypothetical protein DWQ43_10465 [Acidobacteriota bacterium]REK42005.1 MAG: hypothetical protein DWQ47_17375 [Acidobacteriota bacterium]
MQKIQSADSFKRLNSCPACGTQKFLRRQDLTDDQLLVAERFKVPAPAAATAHANEIVYCARCLRPFRQFLDFG